MNKYVLSFLFLLLAGWVTAQNKPLTKPATSQQAPAQGKAGKKSKVYLVKSSSGELVKDPATGKTIVKVHNGVFKQDYSILRSDSAYYYEDKNMVDAFGHVNINQGDTLNIFSDKLNYDGNTKQAILTNHVKMVDKDATLTTDYLTYNTATRIATYTGGGKLVNKDNTLTSKNGYYFSFTKDAYFRYDVVCKTPDALIKTDTMRYNSGTRVNYFYGPTHIYGTKDKDTLYTEDGNYNTVNEQARFGKKNLYTQGTKSLKGDSLFYDRLKGYGRAVKNITFNDNEQKATIKGNLGEFYKADDRAVVTQNAYVIFVTEEKDTSKVDTTKKKPAVLDKSGTAAKPSAAQIKADSIAAKRMGLVPADKTKVNSLKTDKPEIKTAITPTKTYSAAAKRMGLIPVDKSKAGVTKADKPTVKPAGKQPANKADTTKKDKQLITSINGKPDTGHKAKPDTATRIKRDSLFMAADTLETRIMTWKALKTLQRERFEANNRDTTIKVVKHLILTKQPKVLSIEAPKWPEDTSFYHRSYFGKPKPKPAPVVKKKPVVKPVDPKKLAADSARNKRIADSLDVIANHGLKDTSRVRIITGHHHAKIFKSDLQAKSDSMFYSYADSTIRMFDHPMIWTQESQLSGDTVYLQMKNRKLDNMDMFPNAFIVNIDKKDSLHFNQIGGLKMHILFKDSKLSKVYVSGNAESIVLSRDSATNKVKDMARTLSGAIDIRFVKGELTRTTYITQSDNRILPFKDAKEDDKILKGFIWKPKDRPMSKEAVIGRPAKPEVKKPAAKGPVKGTMPIKAESKKKKAGLKSVQTAGKPATTAPTTHRDSTLHATPDTVKKRDTVKKA